MGFVFDFYLVNTEYKMEWLDIIWIVLGGIICICGVLFWK